MTTRTILVGFALIAGTGALAAVLWRPAPVDASAHSETEPPISSEPVRSHVTSLGRLEPASRIIDVSGPPDRRVNRLMVCEGQRVATQNPIAYLDDHALKKATLALAEAELAEAQTLLVAVQECGRATLDQVKKKSQEVQELTVVDMEAQRGVIRRLELELEKAHRDVERAETLATSNATPVQTLEDLRIEAVSLSERLKESRLKLQRLESHLALTKGIELAEIATTQADSQRAELTTNVSSAAARVAVCQADFEQSIVRSPIAATVLKVRTFPGEQIQDAPIVEIGNTDQMYAVAEVYETDARFVQVGQTAVIDSPALAEPLTGVVDEIGTLIDKNDVLDVDPAAPVDARVIEVRIRLNASQVAAKFVNLQVSVKISLNPDGENTVSTTTGRTQ